MTPDDLLEFCLSLPQSEETFPFDEDTSVFKTTGNGKMFALTDLQANPLTISLKVDPEESLALQAEYPQIMRGYHLNKKHWVTIVLNEGVPGVLVQELIRGSHALVKPRIRSPRGSA